MSKPVCPVLAEQWRQRKNERQRIAKGALTVDPRHHARLYAEAFPDRPPLLGTSDWLVGTWAIGACWKNPNPLYGAYPRGYLERVHALFPDARNILHAFSGGLTLEAALDECYAPGPRDGSFDVELVDSQGPDTGRYPTWQGSVLDMPASWTGRFDLVLADPPYSKDDAERYGTPMPLRQHVTTALRRVAKPGGTLVWLDVCWPMHRKDLWRTWGHVGLVRSTNHRVRLVSMFEAVVAGGCA